MARYELRKDDHPEGNRWTVYDTAKNKPALVDGKALRQLPQDDAEELADVLNYLKGREPELGITVAA